MEQLLEGVDPCRAAERCLQAALAQPWGLILLGKGMVSSEQTRCLTDKAIYQKSSVC